MLKKGAIGMGKWAIPAAILYVAVVIGSFNVYAEFIADDKQSVSQTETQSHNTHGEETQSSHQHGSDSEHEDISEVNTFVQNDKNEIKIFLKDKAGNPVNELEVNHEKILHLIVVDEHLQKYYHLHPEQTGKGEFRIGNNLPEGFYKAFIDIKPKNLAYYVAPVPFIVGNPSGLTHSHNEELKPDNNFTQNIDGETVKLNLSSAQANKPVTLTFDLDKTNLTPYLGAMGHVVILDENAQNFLHVHPANDKEPIFETQFKQPGIYKIWAEFKQNGKVRAFPFVIEIK
jgi:hypothetical protein